MAITRRHFLQSGAIAAIAPTLGTASGVPVIDLAQAQTASSEPVWRHALYNAWRQTGSLEAVCACARSMTGTPDAVPRVGAIAAIAPLCKRCRRVIAMRDSCWIREGYSGGNIRQRFDRICCFLLMKVPMTGSLRRNVP